MRTKVEHAAYMRLWRKNHPDQSRATDKAYRDSVKRYRTREKQLGDRKCAFCTIRLASKKVKLKSKRYCDTCRRDPGVKRYMRALYQRRLRQKKAGAEQDSLTLAED